MSEEQPEDGSGTFMSPEEELTAAEVAEENETSKEGAPEPFSEDVTTTPEEDSGPKFELGQKVEARFEGGDFYRGTVMNIDTNGNYDVKFDDGDYGEEVKLVMMLRFVLASLVPRVPSPDPLTCRPLLSV